MDQARPSRDIQTAGEMPSWPTATNPAGPAVTPSISPGSSRSAPPEAGPPALCQLRRSLDHHAAGKVPALVVTVPAIT